MARAAFRSERVQIHYDQGYNDALDEAVRLVREVLGDRVVNGAWQAGDPREGDLIKALEGARP